MLLSGLVLMGFGFLLLLFVHYRKIDLPEGILRSRGIVLQVNVYGNQKQVKIQYFAGRESISTSFNTAESSDFFPGQQVYVDYAANEPDKPLQLLSIQQVLGEKFLGLVIASLLIVAGVVLVRMAS